MTPNQARLSVAQMRVTEAVGKIEDEELREGVLAAIRELTAAWRAVLTKPWTTSPASHAGERRRRSGQAADDALTRGA